MPQMFSRSNALGYFFLVITAVIWVASSFLVQWITADQGVPPVLLTYVVGPHTLQTGAPLDASAAISVQIFANFPQEIFPLLQANTVFIVYLPVFQLGLWVSSRKAAKAERFRRLRTDDDGPRIEPGTADNLGVSDKEALLTEEERSTSDTPLPSPWGASPSPSARARTAVPTLTTLGLPSGRGEGESAGTPTASPGSTPVGTPVSALFRREYVSAELDSARRVDSSRMESSRESDGGYTGPSGLPGHEMSELSLGRGMGGAAGEDVAPSAPRGTEGGLAVRDGIETGSSPPLEIGGFALARHLRAAALVCPLWFAAQLTYNVSLGLTSVTSNSVLR